MTNVIKNLSIETKQNDINTPMRSTIGSAGYDIFSDRKMVIPANKTVSVELPFKFIGELDKSLEVRVFVRSSFGIKKKFRLVDKENKNIKYLVLDLEENNYVINVINDSEQDLIIEKNEHFAQFVICNKEITYEEMMIELVPEQELKKHKILKGKVDEEERNLFVFVLEEDIELKSGEQKIFATGYRSLINEGNWTAITTHNDVGKHLMLANQTAVIDRDYAYTDNYGHCFVGLVNITDQDVLIKKGAKLMKIWTEKYFVLEDEIKNNKKRSGGIGSTND